MDTNDARDQKRQDENTVKTGKNTTQVEEDSTKTEKLDVKDMSDFELAGIVCTKNFIKKINGEFYTFDGRCYAHLSNERLNQLVLNTFWNEQKQIRSTRKIKAIVDALYMLNFLEDRESREWLGFENGVLNLSSWDFYPFPLVFTPPCITYSIQAKYDEHLADFIKNLGEFIPSANPYLDWQDYQVYSSFFNTPVADRFFSEIANGDSDLATRIYEMIGYILIPDTTAKSFFLLQGAPHSGKSVLGRFIEEFFPKGCVTALDISRLSSQYLPKSLTISRLNLSMDLPDGLLPKRAVAMLKMLTGDDLVTLESKYKEAKPYRGQCKFLFSINGKLKVYGRDVAFLNRIVCIPFKNTVPPEKWDTQLKNKLQNERNAIMMKALFCYRKFVERNRIFSGNNKYLPEIEFRLSPNETISQFVEEKCDFVAGMCSYTEDLYSAYLAFCTYNSIKPVGSKSGFAQRLAGLFPTQIDSSRWREDGKNIRGFDGILLKASPIAYTQDEIIHQKTFDEYDASDDSWEREDAE